MSGYPGEKVVVYPSRPVDTSLDMGSNEPTPVGNTANPASGQQRRFQQQGGDQSSSGQGGGSTGSRLGPVRIPPAETTCSLLGSQAERFFTRRAPECHFHTRLNILLFLRRRIDYEDPLGY